MDPLCPDCTCSDLTGKPEAVRVLVEEGSARLEDEDRLGQVRRPDYLSTCGTCYNPTRFTPKPEHLLGLSDPAIDFGTISAPFPRRPAQTR